MEERLDEALKRYGEVEPRSGLERRVFARLQAERAKSAGNRWWLPVTAAAAGIAAIGGAVVLGVRPDHAPVRSKIVATKNNPALAGGARPGLDPQIQARVTPRPRTRRAAVIPDPHAAERRDRTAPRLDRFPSPMPLSEQEQLLADTFRTSVAKRLCWRGHRHSCVKKKPGSGLDWQPEQERLKIRAKNNPRRFDMTEKSRTRVCRTLLVATLLCSGLGSAGAQQSENEAKPRPEQAEKPPVAYRLDYSVNELEDGKKMNSRQYTLNLNAGDANSIKIGTRIPVEAKQGEFQYIDLGTNIWSRVRQQGSELTLEVRADVSSLATPSPDQTVHAGPPLVRQVQINGSTIVVPGKSMVLGVVDDPYSKRQFQLEVTVTKLR
jgi:hypothetical protein